MPGAMTDTFDHSSLHEDEFLAAEYALGVLSGADGAGVEHPVTRAHGFARLVSDWEERLAPWSAEISEVTPPPQVWDRIAATLPTQTQHGGFVRSTTLCSGLR